MDILPPLSEEDRMISGLCYPCWLLVPPLVLLGSRREEPFVHFHALQAVALGALSTVGTVLLVGIVWAVMMILPGSNPALSGLVGVGVFVLGFFLLFFYLTFLFYTAWRAASGRFLRLPLLGTWAESRMQAALGLTLEDYRTEPLEAASRVEPQAVEAPDPAPASSFPTRLIPRSEILAATRGATPEAEPQQVADDFQPGLFPPPRPGGRKFNWDPLDEEESADEEPRPNGFQAW